MKAVPEFSALPMTAYKSSSDTSKRSDEIAAWLLRAAGAGAGAEEVVASIAVIWQDIDGALTPIIGPRGVAALFHRSLHLAAQSQPLLAAIQTGTLTTMDLSALKLQLAAQTPAAAAAAAGVLLHTFHELLGTLIGASLTERLLRAVWPPLLNSTPQDSKS